MAHVDHYMVEYLDEAMGVAFANDRELSSLTGAKALAAKTSKTWDTGAYVVAFTKEGADLGQFVACGHISFFDGRQCETDGVVL
jgi:hypothetical protein